VIGGCCPAGQIPDPVTGICKQTACAVPPNTLVNGKCCSPDDLKQGGACWNCGPGKTPIGPNNFCCDESKVYTDANGAKACCLGGTVINGKCGGGTPMQPGCSPSSTDPNCCASGYKPTGCQQRSDFGVNSPVLFCDHIASPSRSIGRSETVKNAGGSPNISDRTRRCVG
jgi:hypothetical protein